MVLRKLSTRQGAVAVAIGAVVAAALTAWITASADFLAHPGWLAAQKADFILGPVLIGLYWLHRRPRSRFGPMLIAFGCIGGVYVLQSLTDPWLFGIGLVWENVIYLATLALILAFPTGRLDGLAPRLIMLAAFAVAALPATVIVLVLPQLGAGGSISGCRAECPHNALAFTSDPSLALELSDVFRIGAIAVAVATCGLLIWRLVTGTAAQRRALAIGAAIAFVFLLLQITFLLLTLLAADRTALQDAVRWAFAGARAAIWYGFLLALVAAQLFAARALQGLVRGSLRRPSREELQAMLRKPLGDPELQLVFLDGDGEGGRPRPAPGRGRSETIVERADGTPAVAIQHDAGLDDDPELLQAAGAIALLAAENAELDRGWTDALEELRRSRARIVLAGDEERRRVERNLHDGVQQRLVGVGIQLETVGERSGEPATRERLRAIGRSVDEALDELREVSHGLYPPALGDFGLVAALQSSARRTTAPVDVRADSVGRHPAELEAAVFYTILEAVQNSTKHGGPGVRIEVALREDARALSFDVTDDGPGFDPAATRGGAGLQNMRDRVGALDGRLTIASSPAGTVVSGSVPLAAGPSPGRPGGSTPP